MTDKTLYTARAIVKGGREGRAETDDGNIKFDLATPESGKPGTNPEQLFACGYAACFGGALAHVAQKQKVDIGTPEIRSEVKLNQDDAGFHISVLLDVMLPSVDDATAKQLVTAANTICPYSKALKGNVDVSIRVNDQKLAKKAA